MKLWQKDNSNTEHVVEAFTVGRDNQFDSILAKYDVIGSIAHVTMLGKTGLMSPEEANLAVAHLNDILKNIQENNFVIEQGVEDIHSKIELELTKRIGDIGKKIHSGRSRNDQVLTDIKLYLKDQCKILAHKIKLLFDLLIQQSNTHKDYSLPGYTHLQLAMPSSFGLWFGAFAEALIDDLEFLAAAYNIVNKNPLGSGAGYGSSFPLDRKLTTALLGFDDLNVNAVYAQMTRGKAEKSVAIALAQISATLSRLAMDCCLYMNQNFGFIRFPDDLTTGSSIMPHKKNPDVFELIRGKCNRLQALPNELTLLLSNLPSGYHREMQLTKEILFPALQELYACIDMTSLMMSNIIVNKDILLDAKYDQLYTVDSVNFKMKQGSSFRDAYKHVGNIVNEGRYQRPSPSESTTTHIGSIDNLANDQIIASMEKMMSRFPQ